MKRKCEQCKYYDKCFKKKDNKVGERGGKVWLEAVRKRIYIKWL